jgi:outer membrane immunogenic protein
VFEKLGVVFMAQHFNVYSPTMPSDSYNAFKTSVACRIRSEAVGEISMKKFLLATVGLAALGIAAPASAADMPVKAAPPPPPVPIYSWTGFYIGGNGGWGSGRKCWDDATDAFGFLLGSEGCHRAEGGTAGGQIGYRWQNAGWVFGVEGQGNWADFRGSRVSLADPTVVNHSHIDAFGLLTGQVGYAWNNALLYVKGGAAVTNDRFDRTDLATGIFLADTGDRTRWGGTVGVGFEYGFSPGWSVGVEYDHLFMGRKTVDFIDPAGLLFASNRISQDVDMVTVRVNYRFGWGTSPVGPTY